MRKLKLLVLATVCWVAPLAAQQSPFESDSTDCPFARASAEDASTAAANDGVPADGSLLDFGHTAALLP